MNIVRTTFVLDGNGKYDPATTAASAQRTYHDAGTKILGLDPVPAGGYPDNCWVAVRKKAEIIPVASKVPAGKTPIECWWSLDHVIPVVTYFSLIRTVCKPGNNELYVEICAGMAGDMRITVYTAYV